MMPNLKIDRLPECAAVQLYFMTTKLPIYYAAIGCFWPNPDVRPSIAGCQGVNLAAASAGWIRPLAAAHIDRFESHLKKELINEEVTI
jgi:hypothetical protein